MRAGFYAGCFLSVVGSLISCGKSTQPSSALNAEKVQSPNIYCTQVTPAANNGYIIEKMILNVDAKGKYTLQLAAFGSGILNEQGDGTIGSSIFGSDKAIAANFDEKASSKEWKDAIPFHIPLKEKEHGKHVLLVPAEAFAKKPEEFKARFKIEPAEGKEKSVIMKCWAI